MERAAGDLNDTGQAAPTGRAAVGRRAGDGAGGGAVGARRERHGLRQTATSRHFPGDSYRPVQRRCHAAAADTNSPCRRCIMDAVRLFGRWGLRFSGLGQRFSVSVRTCMESSSRAVFVSLCRKAGILAFVFHCVSFSNSISGSVSFSSSVFISASSPSLPPSP